MIVTMAFPSQVWGADFDADVQILAAVSFPQGAEFSVLQESHGELGVSDLKGIGSLFHHNFLNFSLLHFQLHFYINYNQSFE